MDYQNTNVKISMKKNKKFRFFFFILLLFLLLGANFVFALEINYPRVPGTAPPQDFLNDPSVLSEDILSLYAKYLVNLCIWTGGILALTGLIYGGILYLISTGKPDRMVLAKNQISAAFFGLLILLSSYLILKTLSPQFINLKIPTLQTVQFPKKPEIPLPETTAINSSIDAEMPFGRIIEKIFETYISDYPAPKVKKTPRIERIKNNIRAILADTKKGKANGIADKLLSQSEDLKNAADKCTCRQTKPVASCGGNKSGNTTWKCDCGGCSATEPCTCDPCKNVRGKIQDTENKNQTEINNLTAEQIKIEKEVRLLKEELDRLKRAEKFIKECPLRALTSWAQFSSKRDTFDNQKWTLRDIKFWDDVTIKYYTGKYTKDKYGSWYHIPTKEIATDFATFYCAVSGTLEQEYPFSIFAPEAGKLTGKETIEEAEEVMSEAMACSSEAPAGEIIDRAKRVTQLLIDKLEMLVGKDKEMIDAVDKLQVLISQCSSKRGCERRCTCFHCGCGHHPCIDRCQGWIYCCADSSGSYPSTCKDRDKDTPCPYQEIEDQLKEIQRIWQEIKDIIDGKGSNDTPANIGIIPIIEGIAPEIIKDLEREVRKPIHDCSSEDWLEQDTVLFNCLQAKMATIPPENAVLRECCQTQAQNKDTGKMEQTIYGDCFGECYLEKGQEKHRECVQKCLDGLAVMLNDPEIAQCIHELNFYCCHVTK